MKSFQSFIHVSIAGWGVRHLQVLLLFIGLFMSYALRVNISVGIVAMVDNSTDATHNVSYLYMLINVRGDRRRGSDGIQYSELHKTISYRSIDLQFQQWMKMAILRLCTITHKNHIEHK